MKRKLLLTLLTLVFALCGVFGLAACSFAQTGLEYEKVGDGYHVKGYYYAEAVVSHDREPLNLTIPSEYNGKPVTGIGKGALNTHRELVQIELPDSVKTIGSGAFKECTGLLVANLGNGVTNIESSAFYHCEKLPEITIPNGVTSIATYTFYGCVSLTKVTIPDSVTSIGKGAFNDCLRLENIVFDGTKEQWDAVTKDTDWIKGCTKLARIYCTGGADGEEYYITVE